ncbi:class III lanthionine synthetase LanKC [Streptomyces sp. ISL-22]|uniref:class III lanthionine synthetase LanKC n=1 Tax=unclassified Streptomyces TaxID=2593676 RepID=UPI001BEBFC13|nr:MULTISPECIES: class III lanthionine synthetase LanKC [unclassified Streptomyces]MBT2423991.1 class III lanthionine synthetase LanKC [Streptomyces sp. ISL-24]MBT2437848.1 class III lanthionine synthetase LanKC [Streptomyces sp. ISL-22]
MEAARYAEYAQQGNPFYDKPAKRRAIRSYEELVAIPEDWERNTLSQWTVVQPSDAALPVQGWKVHVSATHENAERILKATAEYCISTNTAFKFLSGPVALHQQNHKYAHRGSSGKFIAIYPLDEEGLRTTLNELGDILDGEKGPHILSDLRWRNGPLYVRYGGFAQRFAHDSAGKPVLAVENPDGELVPDEREPVFAPPSWVNVPDFLRRQQADMARPAEFPFRPEAALHFSNGGGVYRATEASTGRTVALKEARPYAGLDMLGVEAVTRLKHEAAVLRRLSGLSCTPEYYDYLTCWEHHFVASEFIEGTTLWKEMITRTPLLGLDGADQRDPEYTAWALNVYDQLERGLQDIHARGVVLGDIHPHNIMVRPDGSVVFIDFEFAGIDDPHHRPAQGAPGFYPPPHLSGVAVDDWLLACLGLHMFYPLTSLLDLSRAKALQLARAIQDRFPVPDDYIRRLTQKLSHGITEGGTGVYATWGRDFSEATPSIAAGILASATPERDDRLFPGDIEQFTTGGLNVAHGAAGVLYALAQTGHGRHEEHEQWLISQVREAAESQLGFYDGLHGIAYVLDHLGHEGEALSLLDRALNRPIRHPGIDLRGGLSGIGLNLLHFAQRNGDADLHKRAVNVGEHLASVLPSTPPSASQLVGQAGLMRGWSGPALLFLRLHEATGDHDYLGLAARALRMDLAGCALTPYATLEVDEGFRVLPYLATGSAGLGMVLQDYLSHHDDEEFRVALEQIVKAAHYEFYIQPNLFNGAAGILFLLTRERVREATSAHDGAIDRLMRLLVLQAIPHESHIAFPGEQLLRLSTDLATGAAGVLLGIDAARTGSPALPFLPSPVSTQTSG